MWRHSSYWLRIDEGDKAKSSAEKISREKQEEIVQTDCVLFEVPSMDSLLPTAPLAVS